MKNVVSFSKDILIAQVLKNNDVYLTIIPRACFGYELVLIISYLTSTTGINVLLKTPQNIENGSKITVTNP